MKVLTLSGFGGTNGTISPADRAHVHSVSFCDFGDGESYVVIGTATGVQARRQRGGGGAYQLFSHCGENTGRGEPA